MSSNIKKSTISIAIIGVLLTANVSAKITDSVNSHINFNAKTFSATDSQKNEPTSYLIVLKATSAANLYAEGTYQAGDARVTMAQISQLQQDLTLELNSLDFNAQIIGQTRVLAPTLIVTASKSALNTIAKDNRVERVLPMFDSQLHISESSDYIKATPLKTQGIATGSGQKVAVLDTGIDYTHIVFNDSAGTVEAYEAAQADPTNVAWPQGQVIGGYDYIRDDADPIENDPKVVTDYDQPTDHGTSASHSVTGIAPDVELYVYSVCGGGCPSAAQAAALESAMDPNKDGDIADRVDVINMSLGGEFGNTYVGSGTQYLIQQATELGVNVVVSAGNDGDHPFRIGGPSTTPNALSVGAMTHPTLEEGFASGTISGATTLIQSASFGPQTAFSFSNTDTELIYPQVNQNGCDEFADNVDFTGKAVLIDRGGCAFVTKVLNAQNRGAAFVIIVNNIDDGQPAPMGGTSTEVTIASVGVNYQAGQTIKNKLAADAVVEYAIQVTMKSMAGAVADFSSRGPSLDGLLKPEITAPGTNIQVAAAGTQNKMAGATGTSFSGPMVAGAVALIREALPERNASEIKATLMNTADLNVTVEAKSVNPDSPLAPISLIGAGLVNVEKAVNLPVAAWVHQPEFDTNQAALSFGFDAISKATSYTKTVTVKSFSTEDKTYNLRTHARYKNDSETGAISWQFPNSITVPAGETIQFDVTLTVDPTKLPEWNLKNPLNAKELAERSPALTLSEFDGALIFDDPNTTGDHDLHLVYHILPRAHIGLDLAYDIANNKISATNNSIKAITPVSEQLIAMGTEVSKVEKELNILATTFNAINSNSCNTGVAFTASIVLRDELIHLRQAGGYAMNLDIDNDGVFDYALAQYSDVGRNAAIPGRSRTVSGEIIDGKPSWKYLTNMYHTTGSNTVTFSGCSDLIGLAENNLKDTITVEASVGYGYDIGAYSVVDTLTGSTTFSTSPATFTDASGTTVTSIASGEKVFISTESIFAITSAEQEGIMALITPEILQKVNSFTPPTLLSAEFAVTENSTEGTVIGQLKLAEQDKYRAIKQYAVQSSTHTSFSVNTSGEVVVTNSDELDYELGNNQATLSVIATDVFDNVSKPTQVTINIENVADTAAEYTPPMLIAQQFSVTENTPNDTVIGQVTLVPQDNTLEVTSYKVSTSSHSAFSINSQGEIVVVNSSELDFEIGKNVATLIVMAIDSMGNTSQEVPITINIENIPDSAAEFTPPKLSDQAFSINENVANGTVVGQLKLEPQENTLAVTSYKVGTTSHSAFSVNKQGEIIVVKSGELDFELGNNVAKLMVTAVDSLGNTSSEALITVNILNLPDSAAEFTPPKLMAMTFSIKENTAKGSIVGQLQLEHQENTLDVVSYELTSSSHSAFEVNEKGEIIVTEPTDLDYELGNNTATLMVVATDSLGNTSAAAEITINIEDVPEKTTEQPIATASTDSSSESSGAFAWLALFTIPFAALRRRKQK